jgi:hypothetical protein
MFEQDVVAYGFRYRYDLAVSSIDRTKTLRNLHSIDFAECDSTTVVVIDCYDEGIANAEVIGRCYTVKLTPQNQDLFF